MTELNDCLYRNLYTHHFVLIMDVDEVVLPIINEDNEKQTVVPNNWQELIAQVEVTLKVNIF